MDFIAYLAADSHRILDLVKSAGFRLSENSGLCRDVQIFGFVSSGQRFVICTANIRRSGFDPYKYVPETILHEAVHVAQQCKGGPFWNAKSNMPLPWNKRQDVMKSLRVSSTSLQLEHEAYWMEDKPAEVERVLRKFCF